MNIIIILAIFVSCAYAIPIDNGVEGEPEIECGATAITANFNTQQNFEGHVYVKGRYAEEGCRVSAGGRRVAGISLPFSTCGVNRRRSENPKGIFVDIVVVISFHPKFVTKVDRAYKLQCFYMEADKTVSTELEVSMLTTAFRTQIVPMPICKYEILDGSPSGPVIKYALIGQQVYHKWICESDASNTFCMTVYGCFVDDGQGDKVDLINDDGCALDGNLIGNLDYMGELMAGKEAHVFKYADRANLYFNCQIRITVREPNAECPLPTCTEPPKTQGRKKRSSVEKRSIHEHIGIVDVVSENIQVLDLDSDTEVHPLTRTHSLTVDGGDQLSSSTSGRHGLCLSTSHLTFAVLAIIAVVVALIVVSVYFVSRK